MSIDTPEKPVQTADTLPPSERDVLDVDKMRSEQSDLGHDVVESLIALSQFTKDQHAKLSRVSYTDKAEDAAIAQLDQEQFAQHVAIEREERIQDIKVTDALVGDMWRPSFEVKVESEYGKLMADLDRISGELGPDNPDLERELDQHNLVLTDIDYRWRGCYFAANSMFTCCGPNFYRENLSLQLF